MQQPTPEQIVAMAKKWRSIYPAYIDSTLKISQGRRLGKSNCVEFPQLQEISEVLSKLQLLHVVEQHKAFSKDILKLGRIKVKILNDDGKPLNPLIKNKWGLLKYIAKTIQVNTKRKIKKPEYQSFEKDIEQQTQQKKNKKKS